MSKEIGTELGHSAHLLMTGEQTAGRCALVELVVRRGEQPPMHSHTREDELVYVLQGEVTFYLGAQRLYRGTGTCVLLPRGCEHTYCVESEEARLLVLLTPAGLEGYYQELDEHREAEHSIEWLVSASARYGLEITGPGPQEARQGGRDPIFQRGGGDSNPQA